MITAELFKNRRTSLCYNWLTKRTMNLTVKTPHLFPNRNYFQKQVLIDQLLSLLRQCTSTKILQQIHNQMLIHSIYEPNHLLPKLIDLKDFNYTSLLFSQILEPNDYAFNVMIRGLTTTWRKFNLSLQFYYKMKTIGLKPNNFTYPFLFIACGNLLAIEHGRLGHSMVLKLGLEVDGYVRHSLITMYSMCGKLSYARRMFDEIAERDAVSWNSMISGYSKMGYAADAVALFRRMMDEGFEPDERSVVSVLGACGDLGDLSSGRWIEGFVVDKKMELNSYIGSALIDMYGKCGDLLSARGVFDRVTHKEVVIWNAMITGYAQNGISDEVMALFKSMTESGVIPNTITLTLLLSACASIGSLDFGKWIEAYASQKGLQYNVYIATALIDMYAKCGSVDQAFRVFKNMPQKNVVSWNTMISALAFHGQAQEALSLFKHMSKEGPTARPDDITFVGVLSACVHAGLVDEGRHFFDKMSSSFGLTPKVEHYSCMVDLLARAGLVYEAWNFIERMPEKPDEIALGALLGACQKVGNIDVSERVMQILLEMEPSNSGNYVISSKIYANCKRWNDSANMRLLMKQRGVTKLPGFSWIEMNAQIHEFHSADSFHNNSEEIYQMLRILYEEMRMEGYMFKVNLSPTEGLRTSS